MIRGALAGLRRRIDRYRVEQRCSLGRNSVVYSPRLVTAIEGGSAGIALGDFTHIRGELTAFPNGRIEFGDYCYLGENSRVWASLLVHVGNRVLISHNVTIMDSRTHPLDPEARHDHFKRIITTGHPADLDLGARPVVIEDDAWIACNAVIFRGVRIGRASIVAAGSIVTQPVPAFCVVAGNPARIISELPPERPR